MVLAQSQMVVLVALAVVLHITEVQAGLLLLGKVMLAVMMDQMLKLEAVAAVRERREVPHLELETGLVVAMVAMELQAVLLAHLLLMRVAVAAVLLLQGQMELEVLEAVLMADKVALLERQILEAVVAADKEAVELDTLEVLAAQA
jgi:hypothetical protein